jgi:hypothetical protein
VKLEIIYVLRGQRRSNLEKISARLALGFSMWLLSGSYENYFQLIADGFSGFLAKS